MTDTPTAEKAQAAASTAADEGKHVAGVAQGEAAKVASEAKTQAKSLASETTSQVADQVNQQTVQQRDKLVSTLGTLGDDLDQMAEGSQGGLAADVAREVATHARSLTSYLDGREPAELLDDVRDFARRRPGLFLAGALVAGVVAGRVARGVKDAPSTGTPGGSAQPSAPAPMYGAPPVTDAGYPDPPPVTPATTAAPAGYDTEATQAFDPLGTDPLGTGPTTPPPSSPPNYSQGPL